MKNQKMIIWAIILGLVGFSIYLFGFQKKQVKEIAGKVKKTLLLNDTDFPLNLGSIGIQVLFFQTYLNITKNQDLALDGIFGPKTKKAANESGFEEVSEGEYKAKIIPYTSIIKHHLKEKEIEF